MKICEIRTSSVSRWYLVNVNSNFSNERNFLFRIANEIFHLILYLLLSTYSRQRSLATLEERGNERHPQSSFSHVYVTLRSERKKEKNQDVRKSYMIKDEERGKRVSLVSLVSIYIYVYIYIVSLIT